MSTLPNKYLRSAYDRITGLNTRFRIMTGKVSMINQEQTCEEHLEILDAALAGDWDRAADSCSTIWSWPATRQRASSRSSVCGKHLNAKDPASSGAGSFALQCVQFLLQAGQRCTDGQLLGHTVSHLPQRTQCRAFSLSGKLSVHCF